LESTLVLAAFLVGGDLGVVVVVVEVVVVVVVVVVPVVVEAGRLCAEAA
jgi:hypothetical protein